MLKKKTCEILKKITEITVKNSVCDASPWYFYQDDEPEEARERFLKQEKEFVKNKC